MEPQRPQPRKSKNVQIVKKLQIPGRDKYMEKFNSLMKRIQSPEIDEARIRPSLEAMQEGGEPPAAGGTVDNMLRSTGAPLKPTIPQDERAPS